MLLTKNGMFLKYTQAYCYNNCHDDGIYFEYIIAHRMIFPCCGHPYTGGMPPHPPAAVTEGNEFDIAMTLFMDQFFQLSAHPMVQLVRRIWISLSNYAET